MNLVGIGFIYFREEIWNALYFSKYYISFCLFGVIYIYSKYIYVIFNVIIIILRNIYLFNVYINCIFIILMRKVLNICVCKIYRKEMI